VAKKTMDIDQLTYKINGAIYEVNRILGTGFLEKVYENALMVELKARNLKAENQVPINVEYKGALVGDYYADIVVENKLIIELKAIEKLRNWPIGKFHTPQGPDKALRFVNPGEARQISCLCLSVYVCG
jgi:GxxExxY protein